MRTKLHIFTILIWATCTYNCFSHPGPIPENASNLLQRIPAVLINSKGEQTNDPAIIRKDFLLFYWGASWYAPCSIFTKQLIDIYNKYRGGDRFEVIFVSMDRSREDMLAHMQEMNMPWYAIAFDQIEMTEVEHFSGGDTPQRGGLPHLMLIDKTGVVLDRGRGRAYAVLYRFASMFKTAD
jgi:hypothetical protein